MRNSKKNLFDELADVTLKLYFILDKRLDSIAEKAGLTYQQTQVLAFLKDKSPVTMTKLAEEFGLSGAGMTGLIDRLIEKKLIVREYDAKDRRMVLVRISQKGKNAAGTHRKRVEDFFRKICQELNDDEKEKFLKLSKRLI
ncbi:MAG: MarR family transcriptional regulator [Chloroflexota bacterium]|nr:MarR family transcriptional regulator [Chloroflexota bacterium]